MARLVRPIVILGAARSGTTLLGDTILARHPDVRYWSEPAHVWRYGHAYRRHDVLDGGDARPQLTAFVRRRFEEFVGPAEGARFMEKTPANCVRMPYVLELLPDASVVHMIRDGRDVALSAREQWEGRGGFRRGDEVVAVSKGPRRALRVLREQLGALERVRDLRSLLELPAYGGRFVNLVLRNMLPLTTLWGPRVPGLKQIRKSLGLIEACAWQWEVCVRMGRSGCRSLPSDRYLELRYEEMLKDPGATVTRTLEFLGLRASPSLVGELVEPVTPWRGHRWKSAMSDEDRTRVERLVGATLDDLGYGTVNAD